MSTEIVIKKGERRTQHWRRLRQALYESVVNFLNEDSLMVSASIAYYALLSVFPLLLLLLSMAGLYIHHRELGGEFATVLERYLPMNPDFIMRNLVSISRAYGRVGLVSFLLLLWSSAGVFLPLEKALNRAWEAEKDRSWWRSRLLALEMALIFSFLILVSLGLVGLNVYVHNWMRRVAFRSAFSLFQLAYRLSLFVTSFGMTLAMFVVLFQRLPNCPMRFRQAFPSALLTTILWEAARSLFTVLLPRFNYRQVYGSIGVVVALMTWAYISSAVMLYGAQISRALYRSLKTAQPSGAGPAPPALQSAGDIR